MLWGPRDAARVAKPEKSPLLAPVANLRRRRVAWSRGKSCVGFHVAEPCCRQALKSRKADGFYVQRSVAKDPLNIQTRGRAFYLTKEQLPSLARPSVRSARSTVPEISAVTPGASPGGPVAAPPQPSGGHRRRRTTPQAAKPPRKGATRPRSRNARESKNSESQPTHRFETQASPKLFTSLCARKRAQNTNSRAPATHRT